VCKFRYLWWSVGHPTEAEKAKEEQEKAKQGKKSAKTTKSKEKRAEKQRKQLEKQEENTAKAKKKALKVAQQLKNESLVKQAQAGTAGQDGAPAILNKMVDLSRAFSMMNSASLYFPGQTEDDKLAVQLGEVSNMLKISYSTKLPTEEDYDKHIQALDNLISRTSTLSRQLHNSKHKLRDKK